MTSNQWTAEKLQALRKALSAGRDGLLPLRPFGKLLGAAVGGRPYSKGWVSRLLRGKKPITDRVARAAHILTMGIAALDEHDWRDPLPTFQGGPVEKLKAAQGEEMHWTELYAQDQDIREFVDTLIELITRG